MLGSTAQTEAEHEARVLAEPYAPYEGYDFGAFQVVEHRRRESWLFDFDDCPPPDRSWHFVFSSVLGAFFEAGLDEIDVQMFMAHRLGIHFHDHNGPQREFATELGSKPAGLVAVPGDEMVAFTLEVNGRANIREARRWLGAVFIPRWVEPVAAQAHELPRQFVESGFLKDRPG